ncbi:lymphotoxin-alpha [Cynocephalus volans]|uniref:lymphotoxin-alpha n=1 Tax=Cynocephalus volans TaxID=110931 RepID=UPI002FCA10D9
MTPPGRLYLPRAYGALLLPLLLGLLLALPPGAQGLPSVGLSHSAAQTDPSTLKPAAHLVGDTRSQDSLHWKVNVDRAFLQHGFSMSNNSLLIPTNGLYFVYSQVVFSGEACSPKVTPIFLAHEVRLLSPQYPLFVPILSTQKFACTGPQRPWVHSMYSGAVFLLSQGDQLSTYTTSISHLVISPSTVFFGAFAV